MMGVHPGSVARWVKLGQLKAHVTPGGHRRITMADLFEFFKEHDVQIPDDMTHQGKLKVLIVEDEKPVLDVLAAGLRAHKDKYRVLTASEGFEAGCKACHLVPNVIVLDIYLPGLDGVNVCKLVKQHRETIKIIAISGKAPEEVQKQIMEAGADMFLNKPFDIEDLIKAIDSIVEEPVLDQK